jgi:hypothetical protein
MKHKKSRRQKGGFNWKFWEKPAPPDPNKPPPKKWWESVWGNNTPNTAQPQPQNITTQPAPAAAAAAAPAPAQESKPISSMGGRKRRTFRKRTGGKSRRKKRKGGNYKSVHHSLTAKPTYWLKY